MILLNQSELQTLDDFMAVCRQYIEQEVSISSYGRVIFVNYPEAASREPIGYWKFGRPFHLQPDIDNIKKLLSSNDIHIND